MLDLSHNKLKDLPASLAGATSLSHLVLSHNQLPALPRVLGRLQQLRHLNASHNWLSGAQELAELLPLWPCLQQLHLRNVSCKRGALALPPQLAQRSVLEVLDEGDQFDLTWSCLQVAVECPVSSCWCCQDDTHQPHTQYPFMIMHMFATCMSVQVLLCMRSRAQTCPYAVQGFL